MSVEETVVRKVKLKTKIKEEDTLNNGNWKKEKVSMVLE
jgi:hypothetical protein